jgi:hypothetical protein
MSELRVTNTNDDRAAVTKELEKASGASGGTNNKQNERRQEIA